MTDPAPNDERPAPAEAGQTSPADSRDRRVRTRLVCLYAGHGLVGIGLLGVVLPVLPTTVFWILAAVCYARSSPERYQRLISHPRAGKPIRDYLDHGVISTSGKRAALIGMTISALILIIAPLSNLALGGGLLGLLIGAIYVATRPSRAPV